jgi:hypothetical protein
VKRDERALRMIEGVAQAPDVLETQLDAERLEREQTGQGVRFQGSGFRVQVSGFRRYQISGIRCQVSGFRRYQVSGIRY